MQNSQKKLKYSRRNNVIMNINFDNLNIELFDTLKIIRERVLDECLSVEMQRLDDMKFDNMLSLDQIDEQIKYTDAYALWVYKVDNIIDEIKAFLYNGIGIYTVLYYYMYNPSRIGLSIYTPHNVSGVLHQLTIDIAQIPSDYLTYGTSKIYAAEANRDICHRFPKYGDLLEYMGEYKRQMTRLDDLVREGDWLLRTDRETLKATYMD